MKNDINKLNCFYWLNISNTSCNSNMKPYYIFDCEDDRSKYYTFSCTKSPINSLDYESSYFTHKSSNILLDRCHEITNSTFDDCQKILDLPSLVANKYEVLIKKLYTNHKFYSFPRKVKNKICEEADSINYTTTDILYDRIGNRFIITKLCEDGRYRCFDFSYIPKKNYAKSYINGYECYINIRYPFYLDNLSDYKLYAYSTALSRIGDPRKAIYCNSNLKFSDPSLLPIGSVLLSKSNNETYIYIKCAQSFNSITYLIGKKGMKIEDYVYKTLPLYKDFNYSFHHINGEEKMKYILSKH